MLTTLRIQGFAIVDQLDVRFGPGLNVLTGETGAGKSLLVEALHLVLGGRMSADVLRDGSDEAVVEALFDLSPDHPVLERLRAAGVPVAPDAAELLVRRTVSRGGRGRAFVNGALCTVGMLESCLRGLVDVTGQHEHVALLDESTHREMLDAFAGVDGDGGALERYRGAYGALMKAVREREALATAREERARRADYLAYQLRELEALDPRVGEEAELERERLLLSSAERLREAARTAEEAISGEDGSAAERVGRAVRALGEAASVDVRLAPTVELLRSASAELDEAGRALSRYSESIGGDPERLAAVEERSGALRALARKHGGSIEAALGRLESMRDELTTLQGGESRLSELEMEVAAAGGRTVAAAAELSLKRREAALRFAQEAERELSELGMERCRLEVALIPPAEGVPSHGGLPLGPDGAERVRFSIGAGGGDIARPLARIASGGELSRILLAVKKALARTDPVATYVFDEVDVGIGGAVAEAVGRALAAVSLERQVVCVTHLPQVAAFARWHLRVEKRIQAGRAVTRVAPLQSSEERVREVARMLAGSTVTPSAFQHAGALISAAHDPAPHAPEGPPVRSTRRMGPGRSVARRAVG